MACVFTLSRQRHRLTVWTRPGEGGILSRPFSQVLQQMWLRAELRDLQQLTCFWLMAVIWGCLLSVGNAFSTKSAHELQPIVHLALPNPSPYQTAAKRRRSKGRTELTEAELLAASYARYSTAHQREESIADQRRKCHEAAERNGHRILPELEFADEAVSGTKRRRDGLDAMLRAAEAGEFRVLYFHSLSRLARESVITMPLLKQLVYSFKVRVISVTEGIDSNRDGWELMATILSVTAEQYIKELSANVFRGQEGVLLAGHSVGDYRFGYKSEPIPGSEISRKGRNAKPMMMYIIDEVAAPWVIRVFHWFVRERRSIRWIARELNRLGAPKDHRAITKKWHHGLVARLLACEKYVGIWRWGEMQNARDPLTGKIHQEDRPDEECQQWRREFPHLRVIDDQTFALAQQRLDENYERHAAHRRDDGTLKWSQRGSADGPPRHLLSRLIKCAECGSTFHVGGAFGQYLFCPGYRDGTCTCPTQLRKDRAERLILAAIGQRILADQIWFEEVFGHMQTAWQRREAEVPSALAATERTLADVDLKIARLVDRIENGDKDPEIGRRLEQRREERRTLQKRLDQLKQSNDLRRPPPTAAWLREQLTQLDQCLQEATPAAAQSLRNLVGGQIVVTEVRREGRKRHHLQGRFAVQAAAVAQAILNADGGYVSESIDTADGPVEQIVIDFVDPNPLDAEAENAKKLFDEGLLRKEIAQRLGWPQSKVTKALKHWFASHDEPYPDGRTRRSQLDHKTIEPPFFQRISDEVFQLCEGGLLLGEIAERLHCNINTITAAKQFAYESRKLPVPDGRTRRKTLRKPSDGEGPTNR